MISFVSISPLPASLRTDDLLRLARALERLIPKKLQGEIGVRFVSENEIRMLNRAYRGKDQATDVLSFEAPHSPRAKRGAEPFLTMRRYEMGDLTVSASFAKREARRRGMAWREELMRLLAHGALHLAGEDHETEKEEARMFAKQERAIACAIGSSYEDKI